MKSNENKCRIKGKIREVESGVDVDIEISGKGCKDLNLKDLQDK
ncbi:MAG: hypothetical protein AABY22_16790 [Nanoarchaeota archaeon]